MGSGINKLQPDTQLDSLNLYKDNIAESDVLNYAELTGVKLLGPYTDGEGIAGSLTVFHAAVSTPFLSTHENYMVVISGSSNGNDGAYIIDTITSSGQVTLHTSLAAAEAGLTFSIYRNPSLEDDINVAITQLSEIIGNPGAGKKWNNNMPRAFDAADTDGSDTKNEKIDLNVIAANWYGSKTKILRNLHFDNQTVAAGNGGKLISTSKPYATPANRTANTVGALPIFKSVANIGTYFDEGEINAVCKVNVIDSATGDEFFNVAGYVVFGKLYDGADYQPSGLGNGTSVYVKFFQDDGSNGGLGSEYTLAASDPTNVRFELPVRKKRIDILEHEEYGQFITSTLGDAETSQDIAQIREALGLADGDVAGDWNLTNTTSYWPFSELTLATATLEDILNKLNEEIGNRNYTNNNILVDGETITQSLDRLDNAVGSAGIKTKIITRVATPILKNAQYTILWATGSNPAITTYRVDASGLGLYMDVYKNGQKLIPHIDASNKGDYAEVDDGAGTGTKIIFKTAIGVGEALEFIVRDNA